MLEQETEQQKRVQFFHASFATKCSIKKKNLHFIVMAGSNQIHQTSVFLFIIRNSSFLPLLDSKKDIVPVCKNFSAISEKEKVH